MSISSSHTADEDQHAKAGRRLLDDRTYGNPLRKLNLDRRVEASDRRLGDDPHYRGPARRLVLDRRLGLDRRDLAHGA